MISLESVITTLSWGLALAVIGMFAILCLLLLRNYKKEQAKPDKASMLNKIRLACVMLPLVWLAVNFSLSAITLAETMFETWLPLVLALILGLGIFEFIFPMLKAQTDKVSKAGNRATRGGKR